MELTEEILKLLMDLVFRLVCSGELSLARVLRKNILDKVDQKKMLSYANSIKPLAARGVAARWGKVHMTKSGSSERQGVPSLETHSSVCHFLSSKYKEDKKTGLIF